ncbi:hypothetical protein AAG570_009772 [Ranatra chinensis]|uniref:Uncharacterized protein n=1 Tax=Ranatra chinensis TaxID=642074 RepID=A0ABD0YQ72_9HEMI
MATGQSLRRKGHFKSSDIAVEYYKTKLKEWSLKFSRQEKEVEEWKKLFALESNAERELWEGEKESNRLRSLIGELQLALYQERELVLGLMRENDQLKIKEAELVTKLQHLELGEGPEPEPAKCPRRGCSGAARPRPPTRQRHPPEQGVSAQVERLLEAKALDHLKIVSLEAELEERTATCRRQVAHMLEERRLGKLECELERKILERKLQYWEERYELLKTSIGSGVLAHIRQTRDSIETDQVLLEKSERLQRQLEECTRQLEVMERKYTDLASDRLEESSTHVQFLMERISQKDELISDYNTRCSILQEQLDELEQAHKEEVGKLKVEKSKLFERVKMLEKRLEDDKKRRLLEGEGFRNDIKLLRAKLTNIERQIKRHRRLKQIEQECQENNAFE